MQYTIHWHEDNTMFSINTYDGTGKIIETSIFNHCGKDLICTTHNLKVDAYQKFKATLNHTSTEIKELLNEN